MYCLLLQIAFAFLAFINEAKQGGTIFTWLLALSRISNFFVWGSICLVHVRFRQAWAYHGRDVKQLAFAAPFGVVGSWIGFGLVVLCLIVAFYAVIAPMSAQNYLAAPIVAVLMVGWGICGIINKDPELKCGIRFTRVQDMDVFSSMGDTALDADPAPRKEYATWGEWLKAAAMRILRSLI